ncbi:hypothetical protein NZK35_25595 [Stieleria sp. ICT_E10.1]|uniref:hypothetical protein n=1 Tax=Stieleria sedimenti TaxID=2976331 RepID=UPI00217F41C7|nr:hypothetical protein [Stieleria sedimenti]MCS7470033.1 hypothetical protein [Stieleria sedimenti]
MTETELLVDCLHRLETAGIDYMLVGSMAGNYWGVPRSTHDIDFVVEYNETQVDAIVEAFQDEFFIQQISVESGLRPPHQFNAFDNRSALKVDFFRVAGDEYEFARFSRRKRITLFDQAAWMLAELREAVGGDEGSRIADQAAKKIAKKYPTLSYAKRAFKEEGLNYR